MKVMGSELLQQMQGMQVEAGSKVMTHAPIEANNSNAVDFGNLLKNAIDNVNGLQGDAKEKATAFEMGDRSVSLGDVMVASQKSSVAFDATVQVRNKLMEAYKEIMSMPV
ncbi:flagellar hook-basal body complex protein FliE [Echinimonas agarilytica]|uniref:Flagellar hook-basal body complex protein FliE n=1 Tax=Echinimonas agarilytica TaxID=1215918 RepID=A0AA41W524_9GAMM|nr:flagellar hook-basal body complex protein FliE [Echinimonas agarilytica]MCM2678963.1 flagellar hook-basal body complex protein FliE [Echinimonas agarilytica]